MTQLEPMFSIRRSARCLLFMLIPLSAVAQSATSLWTFVTGNPVLASPSVAQDGTIFVGSYDRKLYSIDPNGMTNWAFEMDNTITDDSTNGTINGEYRGIYSSPAVGPDGTIYFGGEDGLLYAVDQLTGSNRWTFDVAPATAPAGGTRFSAIYSDPAVDADGIIYIGSYVVDGTGPLRTSQSHLFALNTNGTVRWQYKPAKAIFSDPAIAGDGTIYFGCDDGNLYSLNSNGTLRWTFPTGGPITASPAIGADGAVYIGSTSSRTFFAVNTNGTDRWNFVANGAIYSSAAIGSDGTIYFGSDDASLYALNPDGSMKWSATLGAKIQSSPAIAVDGTIYVGCNDGNLYALNAQGSNLWSFATSSYVYSSPAIAPDGTVYVASADNNLYAIAGPDTTSGLAETPWPMFRSNLRRTGAVEDFNVVQSPLIRAITSVGDGFEVTWNSVPGVTYRLLYRTNLNQIGWLELSGDVQATNTSASKTDSTVTDGERYYRVLSLP
jgi:outer membrane protein assembly factor BamB